MLLIFIIATLVFIITFIITGIVYLIYQIVEGTDDDAPDVLALDTHNFDAIPVVSPLDSEQANSHDSQCVKNQQSLINAQNHGQQQQVTEKDKSKSESLKVKDEKVSNCSTHKQPMAKESTVAGSFLDQYDKKMANKRSTTLAHHPCRVITNSGSNALKTTGSTNGAKNVNDDEDLREMQLGGNGLHWCKTRRALDKLLKQELPLNAVNKNQETPLHVAVRKRNLQMVSGLLCHGADVEQRNEKGETPLIMACKNNDLYVCQILLVFDSNVEAKDKSGKTARHYTACICGRYKEKQQSSPNAAHLILAMLNELGAKRCPMTELNTEEKDANIDKKDETVNKQQKSSNFPCADGCVHSGSYNGNSYNRWVDLSKESVYKRYLFSDIVENLLGSISASSSKVNERGGKCSRLLCIDGGGMRGVIVCQIMIELEKYLSKPMISYFDWIGGTSVGAFLSCALSLGISIQDLRRICFDVKDEVFSGNRPYNPKHLERVLRRTYGATTRMSEVTGRKLAITTALSDRDPCQLKLFRNYSSPSELLEQHNFPSEIYDRMSILSTPSSIIEQTVSVTPTSGSLKSTSSSTSSKGFTVKSANSSRASSPNLIPSVGSKSFQRIENLVAMKEGETTTTTTSRSQIKITAAKGTDVKDEFGPEINEKERDPLIWQAVRASSAAPFFFKPYGPFLDGGIISNNPTLDMLAEFHNYQRVQEFLRKRVGEKDWKNLSLQEPLSKLSLVVSLGTGRGRVVGNQRELDFGSVASGLSTVFSPVELLKSIRGARSLFRKLMHRSCMTDDFIVDRAQGWCSSLNIPYFRINPPLASMFSIDDKRDEQLINALWQTKLYMRSMSSQLRQLCTLLESDYN